MKSLLFGLMFAVALAPFASAAQKPAKSMKATGTIVSATDTSLVISSASKKESTFVLNADTKKDGSMTPGNKVTVTYKKNGMDMVATRVKASGAATTASTSTPSTKPAGKKKAGS